MFAVVMEALLSLGIAVREAALIFHTEDKPGELQLSTETALQPSQHIRTHRNSINLLVEKLQQMPGDQAAAEQEALLRHMSISTQSVHLIHFNALWL